MVFGLTTWLIVSALSGVALAGVGLYVARVGSGEHANRAFGLYAVGFGLTAATSNVLETTWTIPTPLALAALSAQAALSLLAIVSIVAFSLNYPRRVTRADRGVVLWPVVAFVGGVLAMIPYLAGAIEAASGRGAVAVLAVINGVLFETLRLVLICCALSFALRFRREMRDPGDDPQRVAIVSAALVIYPVAFTAWSDVPALLAGRYAVASPFIVNLAVLTVITLVWIGSTRSPHHHAAARNVAIVGVTAALVGMLFRVLDSPISPSWLARTIEILLIAYAILRYQLLGVDVKVRWTISRGTIGAAFIGVFFIASETAQEFFGNVAGSQYLGIAAAGALVFALAPLQRAADHIAAKAVPIATPAAAVGLSMTPATLYRKQLELAWTDGRISANERVMLRNLRKDLGLDAASADEIEHEVETARLRAADRDPTRD